MQKFKLSAIIEIISGGTPKTSVAEYWNGDIPWLSVVDFGDCNKYVYNTEKQITPLGLKESATKVLNAEDIILSARGTVGALAMLGRPMAFNQSCFGLRAKSDVLNQHYLYYYLRNYIRNLKQRCQGSVFDTINLSTFDTLDVYIPCLEEQNKVASLLSSIDLKIDNNNRIISEIESMAKTIYDYWFLQFDFPDENGRPYKSSGGKMVWNEELKREIPEGWHNGTLKSLGNIIGGGTPSTNNEEYYTDNGISWITPKDLSETNNKFIRHGERDITQKGLSNSSAVLMPRGTVLMTSRAPIGYLGIASNEVCTNQGFKSILPKESYDSEFIYQTLNMLMPYIKQIGSGSTFAEVSKSDMEKINIIIPSVKIRVLFNNKIKSINELIENLENENKELASLRDFLLPMLMNGQVTFKE